MIKIQFRDGQTISFDLQKPGDHNAWRRFTAYDEWHESVTALAIASRKSLHTLPAPNHGLTPYGFGAGLIFGRPVHRILGESVWYCVDNLRIKLSVYSTNQKVSKILVERANR